MPRASHAASVNAASGADSHPGAEQHVPGTDPPAPPHVLGVDGNSLAHRAFHALADEPRVPSWLAAAFLRMLAGAWQQGPFDAVVVAFDSPTNRRKELDVNYKANRSDPPEELVDQLADVRRQLVSCGFLVVESDGVEGDDLLAATAVTCEDIGWRCSLLSSDRDLMALVSPTVQLLRPRGSMADLRVYGPARVQAEFGVRPDQYMEFAALRGDPSDGLDGVRGIGPKTAARLLRDYGDVAGIYGALCNVHPRLERQLRAGRAVLERNLRLMTPIGGLSVDVAAAVAAGVDPDRVDATLVPLGHGATAGMFRHAVERPALPPLPPPPDEAPPRAAEDLDPVWQHRPSVRPQPEPAPLVGVQTALF